MDVMFFYVFGTVFSMGTGIMFLVCFLNYICYGLHSDQAKVFSILFALSLLMAFFPKIMHYDTIIEVREVLPVKIDDAYYIKINENICNVNHDFKRDFDENTKIIINKHIYKCKFFNDHIIEKVVKNE